MARRVHGAMTKLQGCERIRTTGLTNQQRSRRSAESRLEAAGEVRRIRKPWRSAISVNACASPVRQQRLIGRLQPNIPKQAIERRAMCRKGSRERAHGDTERVRHAIAAEPRLAQLFPDDGGRQPVKVGRAARKCRVGRTPAQQLLQGPGVTSSQKSSARCRDRAGRARATGRTRRSRADDAPTGWCCGQFDHVLREQARELERIGLVRLHDVELPGDMVRRCSPCSTCAQPLICSITIWASSWPERIRPAVRTTPEGVASTRATEMPAIARLCSRDESRAIRHPAVQHRKGSADHFRPKGEAARGLQQIGRQRIQQTRSSG